MGAAETALTLLRHESKDEILPPLLAIAGDSRQQSYLRTRAVCVLHQMGDAGAVKPLLGCLRAKDVRLRYHAAYALAHLGDISALPALVRVLRHDPDADTRYRAAYALGCLGDTRAVSDLIAALGDDKLHVRHSAASALGKLGDPAALPHLRSLLENDGSPRLRGAAQDAIRRIETGSTSDSAS